MGSISLHRYSIDAYFGSGYEQELPCVELTTTAKIRVTCINLVLASTKMFSQRRRRTHLKKDKKTPEPTWKRTRLPTAEQRARVNNAKAREEAWYGVMTPFHLRENLQLDLTCMRLAYPW